jgi:hypothetical protein
MFATTVTSASKLSSKLSFPLASFFHRLQQTHKTHNTPSAEASSTLSETCKLHNNGSPRRSSSRLAGWLAFKLKPTQRPNPSPNAAAHSQTFLSFSGSKPQTSATAAAKKNEEETTIT